MKKITRQTVLTAALSSAGEPPSEFLIWPYGDVPTTIGDFTLTKENAQAIAASWAERGVECSFDYDHAIYDAQATANGDAPAAGWFVPEAREDGLWATNITWTTKAAQRIKDREYRYFSPAFFVDEGGSITTLVNVAILNNPATHNIAPLVAGAHKHGPGRDHRAIQTGGLSFGEISRRIADALYAAFGWEAWIQDVYDGSAVFEYDGRLYRIGYTVSDTGLTLSGDASEVVKDYKEVEGGSTMKGLLIMLGAGENATEAQGIAVAQSLKTTSEGILRLTGATTPEAALAQVQKWKDDAAKLTGYEADAAKRQADADAEERGRLIEEGMAAGQIPPVQKSYWEGQPTDNVRAFLTSAPKAQVTTDAKTPANGADPATPVEGAKALNAVQTSAIRDAAKAMGQDPEAAVAHAQKTGARFGLE